MNVFPNFLGVRPLSVRVDLRASETVLFPKFGSSHFSLQRLASPRMIELLYLAVIVSICLYKRYSELSYGFFG